MKTRQRTEEQRKKGRERTDLFLKGVGKKEEKRRKDKERRKKKKIAEQLLQVEVDKLRKKVKKLKKALKNMEEEEEESLTDEHMTFGDPPQMADIHQNDEPEEEELEEEKFEEAIEVVKRYLEDEEKVHYLTSLSLLEFNALVEEASPTLELTTWRGKGRLSRFSTIPTPSSTFIFIALLWLKHYPTISFLSSIFFIHPRTCPRVLKRTISALARVMEGEIKFPTDAEMESLRYTFF